MAGRGAGGTTAAPEVSVLIPAWRAAEHIGRAVASVAASGLPAEAVEIVVASDDGSDYSACLPALASLRFCAPGPVASGPGPARNRALALARGRLVAFLDADDTWEPGYLAALAPLARSRGLAFGATSVIDSEREILRLPGGDRLVLERLGETGASFHPVLPRHRAGPFMPGPSHDVVHAVEALARAGGAAAVAGVAYRLELRPGSVSDAPGFSERIARAYAAHAARIRAGQSRVPPGLSERAAGVFEARAALNAAFMAQRQEESFYRFVAARLGTTG